MARDQAHKKVTGFIVPRRLELLEDQSDFLEVERHFGFSIYDFRFLICGV